MSTSKNTVNFQEGRSNEPDCLFRDGKLSEKEWVDHAERNPMIKDFLTWYELTFRDVVPWRPLLNNCGGRSFGNGVAECEQYYDYANMQSPECKQQ